MIDGIWSSGQGCIDITSCFFTLLFGLVVSITTCWFPLLFPLWRSLPCGPVSSELKTARLSPSGNTIPGASSTSTSA